VFIYLLQIIMNQPQSKNLIYGKLFLISIAVLLLNDLYFKHHYHNYLTGKISDFAGLFAFPYFFSILFKRKIKPIFIFTGILFIFWKSNSSQFIIDFFNQIGLGINRVIDYSDLIALIILPFSYRYRLQSSFNVEKLKFIPKPIIIGVCSFAFIATTLPKEYGEINLKSDYEIQKNFQKDSILKQILKVYRTDKDPRYKTTIEIPEKNSRVSVSIIISELENNKTNIKLDSILNFYTNATSLFTGVNKEDVEYIKSLKKEDFERMFINQKINKLN